MRLRWDSNPQPLNPFTTRLEVQRAIHCATEPPQRQPIKPSVSVEAANASCMLRRQGGFVRFLTRGAPPHHHLPPRLPGRSPVHRPSLLTPLLLFFFPQMSSQCLLSIPAAQTCGPRTRCTRRSCRRPFHPLSPTPPRSTLR